MWPFLIISIIGRYLYTGAGAGSSTTGGGAFPLPLPLPISQFAQPLRLATATIAATVNRIFLIKVHLGVIAAFGHKVCGESTINRAVLASSAEK